MRVCIHRGTREIGGTCVELESTGARILLDLGLPLDAVDADPGLVPHVSGLREHDPSLLGIILSHGHRDHWRLIPKARPGIPIVMGKATERIMRAAADFVPDAFAPNAWKHLESGKLSQIGPFAITPHLVDHSGGDRSWRPTPFLFRRPPCSWSKGQDVRTDAKKAAEEHRCHVNGGIEPWTPCRY
jgi:ribonuclease J